QGDRGAMLDIQAARHEEHITGSVPVNRGEFATDVFSVKNIPALCAQRWLEE
ncbi:MAG: hypothetical protein Q9187_006067, partial [Circinaria calcarea]